MRRATPQLLDRAAYLLVALFALDRLLKLAAVHHFFRQPAPPTPSEWPSVSLLQPITSGVHDLRSNLEARSQLTYPGPLHHLLICDAFDRTSHAVCKTWIDHHHGLDAQLVLAASPKGLIATKIEKLQAALPLASNTILCFMDDDVAPRAATLQQLIPYLQSPQIGAVFGLANYTNWRSIWSSLMSGFVNANALLSYIPITYLTQPFTITGHCFALRRTTFHAVDGLNGLEQRVDDDHELARRLRHAGLRSVQTPLIYDIDNDLPTASAYAHQIRRWFVFPRQALWPFLTPLERAITVGGSLGNLLPGLLALLALLTRRRATILGLLATLALWAGGYAHCEVAYLGRRTPLRRWPLLILVALTTPAHVAWSLLADTTITWRGQRLRMARGGHIEVLT